MIGKFPALTVGAVHDTVIVDFALFVALGALGALGVVTGVALTVVENEVHAPLYAATAKV